MHDWSPPKQSSSEPAEKMALFCQECGHTSELDGDWLVKEESEGYWILCPECETTVVSQPVLSD